MQSRYYDPETGRFLNADDVNFIGYSGENLSYNAFAYCENNAVVRRDVSGRVFEYLFVKIFTYYAMIEIITDFLEDYLSVKRVLDIKSFDEDNKTGMFKCRVKYSITNNHWLNIKIGDESAWLKSCVSSNLLNNTSLDAFSSFADFSSGNLGDVDYDAKVMAVYLVISMVGILLTYLDAQHNASISQKFYNQVWGSYGLDPYNQYNYFGIRISNAESDSKERMLNGYYAYSVSKRYGEMISI